MKLMIKDERERLGWSQSQTAKAIGITKAAYRNIEAGIRKPSYDVLVKLLDLFDYSDPRILLGAATPTATEAPDGNPEKNNTPSE